jgi:hypothetical protein
VASSRGEAAAVRSASIERGGAPIALKHDATSDAYAVHSSAGFDSVLEVPAWLPLHPNARTALKRHARQVREGSSRRRPMIELA